MASREPGRLGSPDPIGSQRSSSGPLGTEAEQSRSRLRLCSALVACLAGFALLTARVASHLGGLPVDQRVWRWVVEHRADMPIAAFRMVSHIGDPLVLVVGASISFLWLSRRRPLAVAVVPAAALLAAACTETALKEIIGRPRPPAFARLVTEPDPSFPSGHATGTAALLVAVALIAAPTFRSRTARVLSFAAAGAVAVLVGVARVVLGVHWGSDVAAGWLLGAAWAVGVVLVWPAVERRLSARPATTGPDLAGGRRAAARTSSVGAG